MAKLTLADIANLQNEQSVVNTINANSALIETSLENTLSRDGTTPNQMTADLDMNSHRIINLPSPSGATEPLRLQDLNSFLAGTFALGTSGVFGPVSSTVGHFAQFANTLGSFISDFDLFGTNNTWVAPQSHVGNITLTNNQNGTTALGALNTSSGTAALAALAVGNGTVLGNIGAGGTGYTAVPLLQNKVFVNSASGNGIIILTNDAKPIEFGTNNISRGNIDSTGQWNISGGPLSIVANSNTVIGAAVNNTSAGGSAAAAWGVASGSALGNFGITAATYTAVPLVTNRTFINASGGAGLTVLTNDAQPVIIGTNNTFRGKINATGQWVVGPTNLDPQNSSILLAVNRNTSAPIQKPTGTVVDWIMQVQGANNEKPGITVDSFGSGTTSVFSVYTLRRANGTAAAPSALQSGDLVGVLGGIGYGTTTFSLDQWQIRYYAAQTWTDTAWGTSIAFLTTPNGSTTVAEAMRIDQNAFVGIGTNVPQSRLHINANTTQNVAAISDSLLQISAADSATASIMVNAFGTGAFSGTVYSHARGTAASPSQTAASDVLGYTGARARTNAAAYTGIGCQFSFEASEAQTATAQGKQITVYTTPNASTVITAMARFQASGCLSVGTLTDSGTGLINVLTGFRVNNVATSGNVLRGNGTNFIPAVLAVADLSDTKTGSGNIVLATSPSLTTPSLGVATASSLLANGTGGVGYTTGAGGTVTQTTNKSTTVTLNKICGEITMNGAALAANTIVSFTLVNTTIAAGDVIICNHVTAGTGGSYVIQGGCGAGAAIINVTNITAGTLSEAIGIRFVVIKGATS